MCQNRAKKHLKMSFSQQIINFAKYASHHHVIFCREVIPELTFVNVGLVLSEKILEEGLDSPMLDFATDDFIQEIMSRHVSHPEIGNYLALTNIGILFEPSLSYNISELFKSHSRNKILFIHTQAVIKDDVLYFNNPSDNITAELSGVHYIIV